MFQFINAQDKLFKDDQAAKLAASSSVRLILPTFDNALRSLQSTFEEAEASFRSQIKILEEEIARSKVGQCASGIRRPADNSWLPQRLMVESTRRYRKEQELMLSVLHGFGMRTARDHLGAPTQQARSGGTSWLSQQRHKVRPAYHICGVQ
jgi:protein HOOK3